MKVPTLLSVAVAVLLTSRGLAAPYDDLAANGYRWVNTNGPMKVRDLSDLFLYELWTLFDAKKQAQAVLIRMSRLASYYELLEELKAHADKAKGHMYVINTIISSYQAIPRVKSCEAMKSLIASSEFLFNRCGTANPEALDAALICTSLDILHYELAKLERLRLYAQLLGDRQTLTILNTVSDDSIEAKDRLGYLMGFCVAPDSVSPSKSIPVLGDTPAHSAPGDPLEAINLLNRES